MATVFSLLHWHIIWFIPPEYIARLCNSDLVSFIFGAPCGRRRSIATTVIIAVTALCLLNSSLSIFINLATTGISTAALQILVDIAATPVGSWSRIRPVVTVVTWSAASIIISTVVTTASIVWTARRSSWTNIPRPVPTTIISFKAFSAHTTSAISPMIIVANMPEMDVNVSALSWMFRV